MEHLNVIAQTFGTDKFGIHNYTPVYHRFMEEKRNLPITLFEIGVGGASIPDKGGHSLRMWEAYFPQGKIYSLDLYDKSKLQTDKIKIYQGSQDDPKVLNAIFSEIGQPDFIIDDGSHINRHIIETFKLSFPHLKPGGYYFVEDIQTSYWPSFGGDSFYLHKKNTAINFFKNLVDGINYKEFDNPFYKPDYFAKNITEIHFFHNLIVIKKEENSEESNVVRPSHKVQDFRSLLKNIRYIGRYIKSIIYNFIDRMKF